MTDRVSLWLRQESRETEQRAPIVPEDARWLVTHGATVTVEDSARRIFPIAEYAEAGCRVVPPGSWVDAPGEAIVLGLKELPGHPAALRHRHVFFAHAYKGQPGAADLLRRFRDGGGAVLDLEYLVDDAGRRIAAFGYWAGYLGAALAVRHARGALTGPLSATTGPRLVAALSEQDSARPLRVLVTGALGRSGSGARAALGVAGIEPTCWDIEETRNLDTEALLAHDILVNAVYATGPVRPFLTTAELDDPRRQLSTIADVTCDVGGASNMLPIYDTVTTWRQPVRRLRTGPPPLDLIAIDNLPSLLPWESSVDFSAELAPQLLSIGESGSPWERCLARFHAACRELEVSHG